MGHNLYPIACLTDCCLVLSRFERNDGSAICSVGTDAVGARADYTDAQGGFFCVSPADRSPHQNGVWPSRMLAGF